MKKFLCVLTFIALFASCAYADDYVGFLTRLRTTPEDFFILMKNSWATRGWAILGGDHSTSKARFYDSLVQMQMALSRGDIDEMILPDFAAEYLLKVNKSYTPCCMSNSGTMSLCFGFMKENRTLADRWNFALRSMRDDYTLSGLFQKYVKNFPRDESYDYIYAVNKKKIREQDIIRFEKFPDAPTVRVAVTGDLPPVDFVDEAGLPAGYSMAVLAEISRRLRVNISIIQVDTASRTAALVTGKADAVFWYEVMQSSQENFDVDDDVILSEPYLEWNTFMHLRFHEN